jgi:hypothetical protein
MLIAGPLVLAVYVSIGVLGFTKFMIAMVKIGLI